MIWSAWLLLCLTVRLAEPFSLLHLRAQRLHVRYPGGPWITPGMTVDVRDTKTIPEVSSAGLHCGTRYLMLFIDLDVMMPGTAIQTVVLHWYQPDLMANCMGSTPSAPLVPVGNGVAPHLAPYIGPQPPRNSHHRYVYLLFRQPLTYHFPDCFAHIPPETMDARAGFDVRMFMHAAALEAPVAVNYFFARNEDTGASPTSWSSTSATTTSFRSVACDVADPSTTVGGWRW